MLRYLTSGESHGPALTAILEGVPANMTLTAQDIDRDLARRQVGYGRGGRMKIERDAVEITSGVRLGKTLGSPISLIIKNNDFSNWEKIMSVLPQAPPPEAVTTPRPGHADLGGMVKYNQKDIRNVLERASARETAARVAVGAVAKKLLAEVGTVVIGHVSQISQVRLQPSSYKQPAASFLERIEKSPLRCADEKVEKEMMKAIDKAKKDGDTLGGVFGILVVNPPVGLGSYVHADRRLDAKLAGALMSIPAIKGVEIGLGFASAALPGSGVHDEIFYEKGRGFKHRTNNAGGLEGGVTNGESIVLRAAMKPISTLKKPLKTVDLATKKACEAHVERADVCAVPAAAIIGEAVVAYEMANVVLEKFGSDSVEELHERIAAWRKYVLSL